MRASDHPAPKTVRGNQAPENNRALHSSRHQAPAGSKLATQSSNWLAAGVALFFLYTSRFLLKPLHCHDACFALKASPTHPTGLSSSSRAFKVRCLQWAVVPIQTKMARIKPNKLYIRRVLRFYYVPEDDGDIGFDFTIALALGLFSE